MAESNIFMKCNANLMDTNENLSKSENCTQNFELVNDVKTSSTSVSSKRCEDTMSASSCENIPNNNCVDAGEFSHKSFYEQISETKFDRDDEIPTLDRNCDLHFQDCYNGFKSTLHEESVDLLNISLNNAQDSFGLNFCENNENLKGEVFHDAVQFFKDPSSFSFLENLGASSSTNDFTRSSLCKNFDPLHAKFVNQDANKVNVLQCINEANVEPEPFCEEFKHINSSDPLNDMTPSILPVSDNENHNVNELPQASLEGYTNKFKNVQAPKSSEVLAKSENHQCEIPEKTDDQNSEVFDDLLCFNKLNISTEVPCERTVIAQQPKIIPVVNISSIESISSTLISFDSPMKSNTVKSIDNESQVAVEPQKTYSEEELQHALKIQELHSQEILLKKEQEMEIEGANVKHKMEEKVLHLKNLSLAFYTIVEELSSIALDCSAKKKDLLKYIETTEQENSSLKECVKTLTEDLQSVENTFSDLHKRYEKCKGMLKVYKDNEDNIKLLNEKIQNELKEQKEMYSLLQLKTQEIAEKANLEVANEKKSNDAQLTVLKAQLQKAELKISSLESDNKQLRIENGKLGGICDDLMARVSGT